MKNKIVECDTHIAPQKYYCKKALSLLLSFVMLFSITAGIEFSAYASDSVTSGDYTYKVLADGTIEIDDYIGSDLDVSVPSEIDNKTVTSISRNAFLTQENSLISVVIPDTVTDIDDQMFSHFSKLEAVTLGSGITSIKERMFCYCSNLKSVNIPNGLTSIGRQAFNACRSLSSITIPAGVTSIESGAFDSCDSLTNVILPNGVTSIESATFSDCTNLVSVIMGDKVTSIGSYAFNNCTNLADITLPESVTAIGDNAFCKCVNLVNISIGNNVTSIGKYAFSNCNSLRSITIPEGVTIINDYAFEGLSYLKSVTIPNSVTTIGRHAFCYCVSLDSVTIGNSVTTIGSNAFYNCPSIREITIPNSVTRIESSVFRNSLISNASVYFSGTMDEWNALKTNSESSYELFKSIIYCTDGIVNCNHKFDDGKITKTATCSEKGEITYTCEICDGIKTEAIPTTRHSRNDGEIIQEATCFATGLITYTCTVCNATETVIIPITHKPVRDEMVQPTCTTAGKTPGSHCSVCNEVISEQYTISATGHSFYNETIVKEPTCTEAGIITYICKCNEIKTVTISAKGHTIVNDYAVFPTCTTAGKTTGSHCVDCDAVMTEQKIIPATGHSYDKGKIVKYPTCTEDGIKVYVCKTCTVIKEETIKATGHTVVTDNAVAATCTKAGKTAGSHCSVCNTVIKAQTTVKATGHSYDNGKVTKTATCTATGIKTYTCIKCDATKTEVISATGHTAVTDKAVSATCTKAGKTEGSHCSECNVVIKAQETVWATGHSYDSGKVTKKATCTATGTKTFTCTTCKATKTETIKATGHKAVTDKAVAATCTKAGKTAGSHCSVCNTVIKAQTTVKATGHSYDAGKVTKKATVTTAGVKTYTCTKCKATKTETIPATGLKTPTLKGTVNVNGSFTLSWNKIAGATKYGIYYKNANGQYTWVKTVTGTTWSTATAPYGKKYTYKVIAVSGNVSSAYSNAVNVTNNKKLQTPTLKVAVNKNGSFKLSWGKVTGATKYGIYVKQSNGTYKWVKTVTGTSWTTGVAKKGTTYNYKVIAVTDKNKNANSNYSNVVSAKRK